MPISGSTTAIIAAICAATGALLGSLITTLYNHFNERIKRNLEERDAVSKYRDALLRSAEKLQSQLGHICGGNVPIMVHQPSLSGRAARDSYAYCILIYRISQLFCWTYLLQNDIQTIRYTPTSNDRHIMDILYAIQRGLEAPCTIRGKDAPLRVFRGFQESIGELMCVGDREKGALHCMGYPEFWKAWTMSKDNEFKPWFSQLEWGMEALYKSRRSVTDYFRVMQFQHLLIDLVNALDPKNKRNYAHTRGRIWLIMPPEQHCICTQCTSSRSQGIPTQTWSDRRSGIGILQDSTSTISQTVGNFPRSKPINYHDLGLRAPFP